MERTPDDRRRRELVMVRERRRRYEQERATLPARSALLRSAGRWVRR